MALRTPAFTRITFPLALAAVIIAVAGAFHFLSQVHLMKDRAIRNAEQLSESLARVIDDQVRRSIQSIAIVVDNIAASISSHDDLPDLRMRVAQLPSFPELRSLLYIRPDFSIISTTQDPSSLGEYIGSPEYTAIAEHLSGHEGLALSSTTRTGLVIGDVIDERAIKGSSPPFIPVSRPVRAANGSLLGYIVAMVSVPYLELQHRSLTSPHGARAYVANYNGFLLATTAQNFRAGDRWNTNNPIFTQFLPQTERGTFRGVVEGRGETDIVSFRVTRDWPIVVAISIAEDFALREWKEYSIQSGLRLIATVMSLLIGLVLLGRYLTEIERKDVALALQGATLQNTLDHMSDGLVAFGGDGQVVAANARLMDMIATTEGPPRNVKSFMWRMRKIISSGARREKASDHSSLGNVLRGQVGSTELSTKSGKILEVRSSPTPDGGRILLVNDVTRRREQDDVIRRSEGEKNAIITSALDCIIVADSEGRIREFNPAAERTFGWTKDEVTGRELADTIVPESMREGHRRGMERYLAHGGGNVIGRRIEIKALRRSGEEFPCELAITPINDGHQTFFTAYLRDISARKKAEREVIAAREAAEQATAVKSEFLAHISHEIRTPMNAIVGYSNLALESVDGEDQRQYAEGIADAAKSLLTLVNDVLDLSRLEAGRMSIIEERINLHRLVEQIADTTRILTKDKDIEIKLNSEVAPSARYLGDPDRIRQVLLNLVGNAAKFTERGAIVINVRSAPQGADAEMFEMSVTDTGIGIREDAKPRIFEPFEQDGSRGRARMPGTGLGLAISRSLAQLMGGDIRFHSTQGHGATFTFSLPLKRAPTDKRDVRRVERKFADVPGAFKILVAEDTPASRIIMTRLLERRGFTVVVAEDGEEAVRIAGLERPAAIFLDIQMPKMDGFEAARQIRKLPGPVSTVPIIALTAQAFSSDREHCRAAGMDDFLAKPVLPDRLEEVLARTFNMAAPTVDSTSHCENSALGSHLAAGASLEVFSEPLLRTMIEDIGADTTARILEKSAANADSLIQKLVGSLDAADGRGVRNAAHALVGLLRQIGLNAGAAIAKEIELDAAHASAESISRMQSAITEGMGRARACMADQPEPPDASIVA